MDQTTGQVLEKSLRKDFKPQDKKVGSEVVSKPDRRPSKLTPPTKSKVIVEDLPAKDKEPERPIVSEEPLGALRISQYFFIDTPSQEERQQLDEIWDFARERSGSKSLQSTILAVVQIKGKVGQPRIGESYLDRVYRYVKLRKQEEIISQEMKNMR